MISWVDACRAVVSFSAQGISLRTPFPPRSVGDPLPSESPALPNRSGLNRFKTAWRHNKGTQVDCQEGEVETSATPQRSNTRRFSLAGRSIGLAPQLVDVCNPRATRGQMKLHLFCIALSSRCAL